MLKTKNHQNPWLNLYYLWSSEPEQMLLYSQEILASKTRENNISECVVAWSADHGFPREDRLYKRNSDRWFYFVDSHRGMSQEQEAKWQNRVNILISLLAEKVEPLLPGKRKYFKPEPRLRSVLFPVLFWYNRLNNSLAIASCDNELNEALLWACGFDVEGWRELKEQSERRRQRRCIYCGCQLDLIRYFFLNKDACSTCERSHKIGS